MITWVFLIFGFVFMASFIGALIFELWQDYRNDR